MNFLDQAGSPTPEALGSAVQAASELLLKDAEIKPVNRDEFSTCAEPVEQWQFFYKNGWSDIKQNYIYPGELKDWDKWEKKFDSNLCSTKDLDLAMKKLTESLNNKWTRYTSAEEQAQAEEMSSRGLTASGMEFRQKGKEFEIEFMHYGSAANDDTTLREGDKIVSINGNKLSGLSLTEAEGLAQGKIGQELVVEKEQNGITEKLTLVLKEIPKRIEIESKTLPGEIAYIRLPDFNGEKRIEDFIKSLNELKSDSQTNGRQLNGLILDLRNNPGGDFPNAINLASLFLKDGAVVTKQFVRSRDLENQTELKEKVFSSISMDSLVVNRKAVDPELIAYARELPLTVLVNGSSVSASEVLTGALKDNDRAEIIGARTFGKGVGYREQRFPTGGNLRIAQMKYLTPNGFDPSGKGIEADLPVEQKAGGGDEQLNAAINHLNNLRRK